MTDEYLQHPDQIRGGAAITVLCKQIGDTLETHYPGWLWLVVPDVEGGVLSILSLRLSGEWGYRFRTADISGDAKVASQQIVRAAGEILERFRVPRGTYRYDAWVDAPKFAGMCVPGLNDKPGLTRRRNRDAMLSRALQFGTANLRVRDVQMTDGSRRRELGLRIKS